MDFETFSIGTTPMVKELQASIMSREYPIDTVFLNLGTIVRNCAANDIVKEAIEFDKRRGIETDRPSKILLNEAKKEMINVVQFFCDIFNHAPLVHNPTIVTYHADYSKCIIPELYRTPTHGKRVITMADEFTRTQVIVGKRKQQLQGKTMIVELPLQDKICPWRHLMTELRNCRNEHLVAMISNHPIDYHIGFSCRTFRIFRSYTGDIVWNKDLGRHVFGNNVIPFNIYTHAVLGDKEDVQASIKGTDKTKLLNIAEEEEWILKTRDYIRDRFYQLNIRIPTQF